MNVPCTNCKEKFRLHELTWTEPERIPEIVGRTVRYPYCQECWRKRHESRRDRAYTDEWQ